MIHEIVEDNGNKVYCISSFRCWRPGVYKTRKAAKYAFRFPDEKLTCLQDSISPSEITFEMLQILRQQINEQNFLECLLQIILIRYILP
jgi:hypothetical protein